MYGMKGVISNGIFSLSATAPTGLLFNRSSLSNHGSIFTRPPIGSAGFQIHDIRNPIAEVRADQVRNLLLPRGESGQKESSIAELILIRRIVQQLNSFVARGLFFVGRARETKMM